MVKKASGTTKHPAEILDDNGTLIAGAPGSAARRAGEGQAPAGKRAGPKP